MGYSEPSQRRRRSRITSADIASVIQKSVRAKATMARNAEKQFRGRIAPRKGRIEGRRTACPSKLTVATVVRQGIVCIKIGRAHV